MKIILAPSLLIFLLMLSGCARFVAAVSGPAPVGAADGERTFSQRVEDMSIERTFAINLYKLHPDFANSRVLVMSFYSNVLLVGQVPNETLKKLAADNLKSMREVGTVHNELVVSENATPMVARAHDSVISARIRSALTFAKGFPSSQCKVLVEDGVVYLMAKLKKAEADQAIERVRQVPEVKRIVKLIDYLPD